MSFPPARREDRVEHVQGLAIADPYRWLETPHSDETLAWSAGQDAFARVQLDRLPGRDRLAARLRGLLRSGLVGPPAWRCSRALYLRREPDQQHAALVLREPDGRNRVLLDPGALDSTGRTTLDGWWPSPDGRLLAYALSESGDEETQLRVLAVDSGVIVDGPIDRTRYGDVAWLADSAGFYHVRRQPPDAVPAGEQAFHRRVLLHRVGADPVADVIVYGEGLEPTNYYQLDVSHDGRWLAVTASAGTAPRTEVWIADLAGPGGAERPDLVVVQGGVDAQSWPRFGPDGRLWLHTDRDAPRGRVCALDPRHPEYANWDEVVPEDRGAVLGPWALLDDTVVVARSRHAVSEVSVVEHTGVLRHRVTLPGVGSVDAITARRDGGTQAWLSWTDHVTPPGVRRLDAATGTLSVWESAPGDIDPPPVRVWQEPYRSADGTEVWLTVVAPAGSGTADRPSPRPAVLYGYGGFDIALSPAYSASTLAWVEAGGLWAVAHLRGGSEEGEAWHRAGMRERKQNVFDDLHAAADHLLRRGLTAPDRLAIMGGSNGGLLVGAALSQRPDLYAAVVCSAPLLDMIRYEKFGLGRTWNDEYGRAEDPDEVRWLHSYSPYHAVVEQRAGIPTRWPATLFTVFDNDTRVDPMHARKLCAAMQATQAGDAPILLRREADVGHGPRSIDRTVALATDQLSFLADRLGLEFS